MSNPKIAATNGGGHALLQWGPNVCFSPPPPNLKTPQSITNEPARPASPSSYPTLDAFHATCPRHHHIPSRPQTIPRHRETTRRRHRPTTPQGSRPPRLLIQHRGADPSRLRLLQRPTPLHHVHGHPALPRVHGQRRQRPRGRRRLCEAPPPVRR